MHGSRYVSFMESTCQRARRADKFRGVREDARKADEFSRMGTTPKPQWGQSHVYQRHRFNLRHWKLRLRIIFRRWRWGYSPNWTSSTLISGDVSEVVWSGLQKTRSAEKVTRLLLGSQINRIVQHVVVAHGYDVLSVNSVAQI